MTLQAVESEVAQITSEAVPSDELTVPSTAQQRHFSQDSAEVLDEYNHLHKKQHHFGSHMTSDVSGGGLWFGTYTEEQADAMLDAEQNGGERPDESKRERYGSGQYVDRKLHESERRLLQTKDELAETKRALADATREVELGKHEVEQRAAELKNTEYKVKCLLRMLKDILPSVMDKQPQGAGDYGGPAPPPPPGTDITATRRASAINPKDLAAATRQEEMLDENTDLPNFIDMKIASIANTLPLCSQMFASAPGGDSLLLTAPGGSPGRKPIPPQVRQQVEKMISEYRDRAAATGSPQMFSP